MKYNILKSFIVIFLTLSLTGCVKMALTFMPSFVPRLSQTFFEECDPKLAEQALPASLKLLEGILKNDPGNEQILTALCSGFTGYALLFVEEEDHESASLLYRRARDYGLRALGQKDPTNSAGKKDETLDWIRAVGKKDLDTLFWTTMAWNAWINLNLDKPTALGQFSISKACLNRVMEINPGYFYGAPHILQGTLLAAVPVPLGGDTKKAKENFEQAMKLSENKFFMAHYYFARYYAVSVQDKHLFRKLIKDVQDKSLNEMQDVCLINAVMKQRLERLGAMEDDFFL